jgi:hypothetical protein
MNIDKFLLLGYDGASLGSWILFFRCNVTTTSKIESSKYIYFWGVILTREMKKLHFLESIHPITQWRIFMTQKKRVPGIIAPWLQNSIHYFTESLYFKSSYPWSEKQTNKQTRKLGFFTISYPKHLPNISRIKLPWHYFLNRDRF